MTHARLLAVAVAAALLPAAAAGQNREEQQILADLRILQEQVQRLQLTVNTLSGALTATNGRVDQQATDVRREFAALQSVITTMTDDMSTLRENLYDNTTRVSKLAQEFAAVRQGLVDANGLLAEIVKLLSGPPMPPDLDPLGARPPGAATTDPPQGLTPPSAPASPAAYYSQALSYYSQGQYDLAIEAYTDFLERFPSAPQAAEAQFFIGESHYQSGRYQEALDAFATVTATYEGPEHTDYVTGALYRQGLCREQLGQRDEAIALYQRLRTEHPDTVAGVNATQALIRLGIIKTDGGG